MSQNSSDNVLILDAGDDSGRITAAAANAKVDVEDPPQALRSTAGEPIPSQHTPVGKTLDPIVDVNKPDFG